MTAPEIMSQLEELGLASYKKVLINHGVREPFFGVKIEELKKLQKRIKKDYPLSLDLFATRNYDAQYLAGLIADEARMTPDDLRRWLATANCSAICCSALAWTAAEGPHGWALALEWIQSSDETTAQTGWNTLSSIVSITDDARLDLPELRRLLECVDRSIHQQPNRVRYSMNGFVIALGAYVASLTEAALQAGERIGPVRVEMGKTACKVPSSPDYIRKIQSRGAIGNKRKTARC